MRTLLASTLLLGLMACSDDNDDDGLDTFDTGLRDMTETDVGYVEFADVITDGGVTFTVYEDCLTGSARDIDLSCEATLEGTRILLSSTLDYRVGRAQTDDCNVHTATCSIDGLTEETYQVAYRDEEATLTATGDGSTVRVPSGQG